MSTKDRQQRSCLADPVFRMAAAGLLSALPRSATSLRPVIALLCLPLLLMAEASLANDTEKTRFTDLFDNISAAPTYLQYQYGFASDSDFGVAVLFYYDGSQENTYANALSIGWHLSDDFYGWPVELSLYTGLQQFDEKGLQPDAYGISIYPKLYKEFNIPFTDIPLRAGLGIGLNYISRIPLAEKRDFAPDSSEKLVVYIDYTLQLSVARMLGRPAGLSAAISDIYLGYTILHRSTAYGTFAETGGGINYLGFGAELVLR